MAEHEIPRCVKIILYVLSTCMLVLSGIVLERAFEKAFEGFSLSRIYIRPEYWRLLIRRIIRRIRKQRAWFLCGTLLLVVGGLLSSFATFAPTRIDAQTVVAQGSLLLAYGAGGELDWATPLPSNIIEHSPLSDLDGDRVEETVVATEPYDGGGSRLVIINENGRAVFTFEARRYHRLEIVPDDVDSTLDIPLVYDYTSRTFEIADLLVQDLDGLDGQEILLLANDITQRYAPSLILGLKANGELTAWYWHFGRLQTARVLQTSRPEKGPLIVVLGENPLVEDDVYASVVFALSGTEFFAGDGPMCWNLTTTMASNYVFEMEKLRTIYDDDLAVVLGCLGFDAGALAWYRWIEPGVTVEEMTIGWVTVHYRFTVSPWSEVRRVVSLALSNGCPLGINEWGQTEDIQSIQPCPQVLRPVLIRPWRY